jgi:uncharacterized membrane protein
MNCIHSFLPFQCIIDIRARVSVLLLLLYYCCSFVLVANSFVNADLWQKRFFKTLHAKILISSRNCIFLLQLCCFSTRGAAGTPLCGDCLML